MINTISDIVIALGTAGMAVAAWIALRSWRKEFIGKKKIELACGCKFSDCTHTSEPGCAVLAAIESGNMDERRFKNYVRMQKETRFQSDKAGAIKAKQEWHKKLSKVIRQMKH